MANIDVGYLPTYDPISSSVRTSQTGYDYETIPNSVRSSTSAAFSLTANAGTFVSKEKSPQLPTIDITRKPTTQMMSAAELAQKMRLKNECPIIIDCRSFIAFNAGHLTDAINVNCADRLMRKRLQGGKMRLLDLITCPEGKRRLVDETTNVVAYDDDTVAVETSCQSSLLLILGLLVNLGKRVFYLEGGLKEFERKHGELCYKPANSDKPQRPLCSPTSPVVEAGIDTATVTEILPYLYLGNECDAADAELLQRHQITHVLNVTSNIPFRCEHLILTNKRLSASDSAIQDIRQYFSEALSFIDDAQKSGGKILVHCQAGVSRSPTIVIAYLMHQRGMTLMDAFHYVRARRSIVAPNLSFMGQLLAFEQTLRKVVNAMTSSSTTPGESETTSCIAGEMVA